MRFEYNDYVDVLVVWLSQPTSPCVYVESRTPGVILRVEESTGSIRGFEVLAWKRRIEKGDVLIPEVTNPDFQSQWISHQALFNKNI